MKHNVRFLWLSLMLALCVTTASADMGPKPSIRVDVTGLEGQTCCGTLLSKWESTGPYSAWEGPPEDIRCEADDTYYSVEEITPELRERWQAFQDYEDPEGYYFLQIWWTVTEGDGIAWTYRCPSDFKVLLWFPETGEYRASQAYEAYAFDSSYALDLSAEGPLILERDYDYTWELISLLVRIVLTLAVELALAWVFRYRNRSQLTCILVTNLITQIGLNVALNVANYTSGQYAYVFWFVLLELAVFIVEAVVYAHRLGGEKGHPVLYALCANGLSAAAGLWLAMHIPGIF